MPMYWIILFGKENCYCFTDLYNGRGESEADGHNINVMPHKRYDLNFNLESFKIMQAYYPHVCSDQVVLKGSFNEKKKNL